jgi:hypothetical protein
MQPDYGEPTRVAIEVADSEKRFAVFIELGVDQKANQEVRRNPRR